jgi:ketosteroid isomerase-like protein
VSAADVARSYVESFASADADVIAAHVADDFVNEHASALGSGCRGRDEYRRRLAGFLASLPGLRYEVEQVIGDGSTVAVPYRLTAVSGGHPVDLRGVMVIDVVDGAITRRTDYWDALTFLRQTEG